MPLCVLLEKNNFPFTFFLFFLRFCGSGDLCWKLEDRKGEEILHKVIGRESNLQVLQEGYRLCIWTACSTKRAIWQRSLPSHIGLAVVSRPQYSLGEHIYEEFLPQSTSDKTLMGLRSTWLSFVSELLPDCCDFVNQACIIDRSPSSHFIAIVKDFFFFFLQRKLLIHLNSQVLFNIVSFYSCLVALCVRLQNHWCRRLETVQM